MADDDVVIRVNSETGDREKLSSNWVVEVLDQQSLGTIRRGRRKTSK